jgi:multidrug efflux pump subunit AcrB
MNDGRSRLTAAVEAVAEVGNPTIVATLTVVAALLPMLFVSGLMGPYMAPNPANASAAMLFSFFVAVVIAPWMMLRLAPAASGAHAGGGGHVVAHTEGWLGRLYRVIARSVIRTRRSAWRFLIGVGVATLLVMLLFVAKLVTVKLLPFDNKSEIAVVVDLPEGASLEQTERDLLEAAEIARQVPELRSVQAYAGTRRRSTSTAWCATTMLGRCRSWASCSSTWRRAMSARAAATPSRSTCASVSRCWRSRPALSSKWSRCRRDRRFSPPCSPKSTGRIPRRAARSWRR